MDNSQPSAADWSSLCAEALESVKQVEMPGNFQIPALPTSLTRFVEASKSPDADMRKLGAIIEHDPGLSLDLLRFVNAAIRASANPARTPTDALIRLGIPTTRNFLLSAGIKSTTLGLRSKLMNHHNFWNESLRRAVFARTVAGRLNTDAEVAFMGGLLQDFMLPVLTNAVDDAYLEYLELEERGGDYWQKVQIVDQKGFRHLLLYRMQQTDEGWRIGGVQILKVPGATA